MSIDLFVYGTLKPGEISYHLCAQQVLEAHPVRVRGMLFHLPLGYPALTLEGDQWAWGFLLRFADETILDVLDDYEAHAPEVLEREVPGIEIDQVQYDRQWVQTYDLTAQPFDRAWVYVMTPEQIQSLGGIWLPEGKWSSQQTYRMS